VAILIGEVSSFQGLFLDFGLPMWELKAQELPRPNVSHSPNLFFYF
jgi:hypothetical protein